MTVGSCGSQECSPCRGSPFTRALPVGASPPLWVLGMQVCPSPRPYSPHRSGQPAQDHSAHFLPTEHTQEVQPVVGKPVPEPKNRWTRLVGQGRAGWQVVVVAGALLCACWSPSSSSAQTCPTSVLGQLPHREQPRAEKDFEEESDFK